MRTWIVYWLYARYSLNPEKEKDGYVGCTAKNRIHKRLWQHHESGRFPDFSVMVLFEGSQAQCLALEKELRPQPHIGWNIHIGGSPRGGGGKGVPKSPEHRENQRLAALARYQRPGERERTQKAVKKAFKTIDRSGANNPHYGHRHSEATKQLISDRKRGL